MLRRVDHRIGSRRTVPAEETGTVGGYNRMLLHENHLFDFLELAVVDRDPVVVHAGRHPGAVEFHPVLARAELLAVGQRRHQLSQ